MKKFFLKTFFIVLLFASFNLSSTNAQNQKKLQKLIEKDKYEKVISLSTKRLKKGKRDSVSYYYLSLGLVIKAKDNHVNLNERNYYLATKAYTKYLNTKSSPDTVSELYHTMYDFGLQIIRIIPEHNENRRKYYARYFASTFNDTIPDYHELLIPHHVAKQTLTGSLARDPNLDHHESVRKTKDHINYKLPKIIPQGDVIVKSAESAIGTPWIWAGITPDKGFDCSGFVIWAFKQYGYELPHRTKLLAQIGKYVAPDNILASDIICFGSNTYDPNSVWHMGLVYSVNKDQIQMIHCGTTKGVSIVPLTSGYWSEKEHFIVRISE